jgi:sugar fermentation stimulation protein A
MSQVYALVIHANRSARVGRLGLLRFRGTYVYVGSALGKTARGRIQRHMDIAEGRRTGGFWHVDRLLRIGELEAIVRADTKTRRECAVAGRVNRVAAEAVPRFGSSDCRCASHLFRLEHDNAVGAVSHAMDELGLRPEVTVLRARATRRAFR